MCMVGDEEYWDWFTSHHPRARKEHVCGECRRTIRRGETYWRHGGVHEGTFVWHVMCEHCEAATGWLVIVCDGYIFGRTEEDFTSHVTGDERELRSRPLTRLLRWMRADWCDRSGALRPVGDVMDLSNDAVRAYREQRDAYRSPVGL